jgi:hypothetical protein
MSECPKDSAARHDIVEPLKLAIHAHNLARVGATARMAVEATRNRGTAHAKLPLSHPRCERTVYRRETSGGQQYGTVTAKLWIRQHLQDGLAHKLGRARHAKLG